ncbi:hypothetical protein CRI94_17310 [Longibacter salinarum]|uniref:Uncharacterized protein n=1 Tax=Longibacter salinarum TaxID=1850348 RepID=A0A2A8CTH9_9BACT|nr:hypothetical protein [Longibacter salinarum]PEN10375.1 hypothetical protein CRI94_17310 [Longibacter salinarum]
MSDAKRSALGGAMKSKQRRNADVQEAEDAAAEERDQTPVQLNVRVPAWLRKELNLHKIRSEETIEEAVQEALRNYLDV